MKTYQLKEVFIPVGLPDVTFVRRPNLERSVRSWEISEAKHLLIFGPSKSGKTSLWKRYVPGEKIIKIPCNASKTLTEVYSEILYELNSFYELERTRSSSNNSGIAAELQSIIGFGTAKVSAQLASTGIYANKQVRISQPSIGCNLVIKFLKPTRKIVILEDFHYANQDLKSALSEDLKAFSDEKCPWILVGVQHKTSELLSYNLDLQQRISELPVEGFDDTQLRKIIELGETALNVRFSPEVQDLIIKEAISSASIVQNICQRICLIKNIEKTQKNIFIIDEVSVVDEACREIAYDNKSYYERAIKSISLGGRSDGSTEKYKWFLKMIKERDIPEQGLKNTEVYRYLKDLGHDSIQQGSVTSGLGYLPKLLEKNNYPAFFDFDSDNNKTFYLLDKYMKFVFKWIPELVDDIFIEEEQDSQQLGLNIEE
jgi:GTPase SAR1 family protein